MSTNFEATQRYYTGGEAQALLKITQSFRLSQNFQLKFKYNYKDREIDSIKSDEQTYRAVLNYNF